MTNMTNTQSAIRNLGKTEVDGAIRDFGLKAGVDAAIRDFGLKTQD